MVPSGVTFSRLADAFIQIEIEVIHTMSRGSLAQGHFKCCPCFCGFQSIQRRLEEIEVTFKDLEEKGVVLERTLRGEAGKNTVSPADELSFLIH